MNFNTNFHSKFAKNNFFRQVITMLCLVLLVYAGWHWLNARQNNDLSFLLPIYQDGEAIQPSAIISEDGQVLLPVRAIAENNGWLCQTRELKSKDDQQTNTCGALLLLNESSDTPDAPQAVVISWLSDKTANNQPVSLGAWLSAAQTAQAGSQLLNLSAPGRFYQGELYLPEDFFSAAFGLNLKLDEQGRANLLRPSDIAPQA